MPFSNWPEIVYELLIAYSFFKNVFDDSLLEAEIRKHLFDPTVLIFKSFESLTSDASIFGLSVLISRIGYAIFMADVIDLLTCLYFLQNPDDLCFCVA